MTVHLSPETRVPVLAAEQPEPPVGVESPRRRRESGVLNVFSHAFLVTWAILVLVPLLWCLVSAFKSDEEILSSAWSIPAQLRWENFTRAWATAQIGRYFLNTALVVVVGVTLNLVMGSLIAYVVARYPFRGARAVYYLFVAGLVFPTFLAIVPLFFVAQNLGLTNNLFGLALINSVYGLPFTVFFLTAYFRTLPSALAEAAFVDGCGHWGTFFRIMLPLARPGLVSVGIFVTIGDWNQYLLPLVLQTDPNQYVIAQGLARLAVQQGYASDWSGLFAGLTLSMLPVVVVYAVFQRHIQTGMVAGAVR